ncbi:MAG: Na+/H+ antiporter subunit E, partial [Anaerolineales bacterium]|nr:Na+/H+ antiporter subunit E [Anaerolineales bacterium]
VWVPVTGLYWLLTGNFEAANLVVGLLLGLGAAALIRPSRRPVAWRRLPGALLAGVQYVVILLVDLARSGVQVTRIVLSPALPIRPGIVAIPSGCESELATALSAHAITVTPGEMVVEIGEDGVMYTHCLDAAAAAQQLGEAQAMRRKLLQRIFE